MTEILTVRDPIAPTEQIWLTIDFGLQLRTGATIASVSFDAAVLEGSDTTPEARLLTGSYGGIVSPSLVPSLATGLGGQAVCQMVGTCLLGCVYRIECLATTSDGEILSAVLLLTCAQLP